MTLAPLRRLNFPVTLLILALILAYAVNVPSGWQRVLDWLPYASLGMALALSGFNGRSRMVAVTAGLLIIYYVVLTWLQISLSESAPLRIYSFISVLYPLLVLILLFVPERGLWNRYGAVVVSLVPILLLAAVLCFQYVPEATQLEFIESHLTVKPFPGYVLSVYASIAFGVVLLAGIVQLYRHDSEHDAALMAALLFVFLMLVLFDRAGISDVMFSLAGISLLYSLMRGSYELAYHDELTGLLGRRALNERLKSLGRQYVIAMLDVDHFKKFNDTYGHDTGDEVLKMVAKHIASVGGGGTAYRYGGEEFCIVFPGREIEYCRPFLEATRATIAAYKMILRDTRHRPQSPEDIRERRGRRASNRKGNTVSVTVSIGMAAPDETRVTPDDVIKAADEMLYQAKKKGRNRVEPN